MQPRAVPVGALNAIGDHPEVVLQVEHGAAMDAGSGVPLVAVVLARGYGVGLRVLETQKPRFRLVEGLELAEEKHLVSAVHDDGVVA